MSMDFRSFGINGAPPPGGKQQGADFDRKWWTLKPDDAAKAVAASTSYLQAHQAARNTQLVISARMYGNASMLGAPGLSYLRNATIQAAMRERLAYNLIQSVVDTIVAKMAKNKPRPFHVTDGGDNEMQRRAKQLNKLTDGIFYEAQADERRQEARRDGAVWGDGIIHVYGERGRVKWERALPHEFYVDEFEGFYGDPRTLTREKAVDRGMLMDLYPGKKKYLKDANPASAEQRALYPNIADLVTVRESWHLPSGPDAGDGAHMIAIDDHALLFEEWTRQSFPFARFRWAKRLYGFWSQGAAERLQPLQMEINALLACVQRATKLSGMHYWLVENGSKVAKSLITNAMGTIVPYTNTPPQIVTPPIIPQEIYQQIETLIRRGYEQEGVSQLSAMSQKPAGLNSGRALREFNDIESDRFQTLGKEDERFAMELTTLSLDAAKEIAEEQGSYSVKAVGARALKVIDMKPADLDVDGFVIKCFPVSSLPSEPAGRMQTIQEMVQAGWIPPNMGPKLMAMPDLEQYESLTNAMEERLESIFDDIVDEGEYAPPEPWYDPDRSRELCMQYILRGEEQDLDPERLELLHTFLSQLDVLDQQAAVAAAGAATPGVAVPQAQPQPPPVSDSLPFAGSAPGQMQ